MVVTIPSSLFLLNFIILSQRKQVVTSSSIVEAPLDLAHQLCTSARRSNGSRARMTVIDYALSLALSTDPGPRSNLLALFESLNYLLRSFPD